MRKAVIVGLSVFVLLALAGGLWLSIHLYEERVAQLEQEVDGTRRELLVVDKTLQQERERLKTARSAADLASESAEQERVLRSEAEEEARLAEERRQLALQEADEAERKAEEARQDALRAEQNLQTVIEARQAELDRMQQALSRIVETRRTAKGMVVVLGDSHFKFGFDSAELNTANRELLSRVAGVLLASSGYHLNIDGHTDDLGPAEYNQRLSERRARAVADYLIQAGLPPELVDVQGYGEDQPKVEAATREARAENRRVEIGITDTVITYHGVASNGISAPAIPSN